MCSMLLSYSCIHKKEGTMDLEPNSNLALNKKNIEDEIWKREQVYWGSLKSRDFSKYKSNLHRHFTDWPSSTKEPIDNLDSMVTFASNTLNNFAEVDFVLNHKLTQVINSEEVIVYFHCKIVGILIDNSKVNSTNRMIHIWHKDEDTFKLIGGMQSELE